MRKLICVCLAVMLLAGVCIACAEEKIIEVENKVPIPKLAPKDRAAAAGESPFTGLPASGEAYTPIMVPLGDLAGVTRQVTVLAYQFGDGYSNMLWPTCSVATMCGIGKIPLDRWYKFFLPVFAVCFLVQVVLLLIAVAIGYA